jgi:hypothetical protein
MRAPAFPAGSVFMSSAFSWITTLVPPAWNREVAGSGAIAGEGNVLDCAFDGALAVRADRQIRQITSVMTFWVLHAMLLVRRIEVATRRREARGIALTGFVDVDGVNSRT